MGISTSKLTAAFNEASDAEAMEYYPLFCAMKGASPLQQRKTQVQREELSIEQMVSFFDPQIEIVTKSLFRLFDTRGLDMITFFEFSSHLLCFKHFTLNPKSYMLFKLLDVNKTQQIGKSELDIIYNVLENKNMYICTELRTVTDQLFAKQKDSAIKEQFFVEQLTANPRWIDMFLECYFTLYPAFCFSFSKFVDISQSKLNQFKQKNKNSPKPPQKNPPAPTKKDDKAKKQTTNKKEEKELPSKPLPSPVAPKPTQTEKAYNPFDDDTATQDTKADNKTVQNPFEENKPKPIAQQSLLDDEDLGKFGMEMLDFVVIDSTEMKTPLDTFGAGCVKKFEGQVVISVEDYCQG